LLGLTACDKIKHGGQKAEVVPPHSTETNQAGDMTDSENLKSNDNTLENASAKLMPPTKDEVGDPDEVAVLTTEKGIIVLEFYPDAAPLHVANFKKLAKVGFYDGTTFHRVIPGFMIQGGDPNSKDDNPFNDGQGGPPYTVPAEFNKISHEPGILSMARSSDPNSAGSQFFICLGSPKHLDGQYTVFGKVIKGLDVVNMIGNTRREPPRDAEKPAVLIKSVKIVKKSEIKM
jgi:cyclophilin family peptidyl-prolyl cis-trans isomerase